MTHYPAAHINALSEEGTKAEAIEYLQKHWNALQDAKAEIRRLQHGKKEQEAWSSENMRKFRNSTIEKCARVIEAEAYDHDEMVRLAAVIRALKQP